MCFILFLVWLLPLSDELCVFVHHRRHSLLLWKDVLLWMWSASVTSSHVLVLEHLHKIASAIEFVAVGIIVGILFWCIRIRILQSDGIVAEISNEWIAFTAYSEHLRFDCHNVINIYSGSKRMLPKYGCNHHIFFMLYCTKIRTKGSGAVNITPLDFGGGVHESEVDGCYWADATSLSLSDPSTRRPQKSQPTKPHHIIPNHFSASFFLSTTYYIFHFGLLVGIGTTTI